MSFLSISLTIHDDTRGGIVGEIWERGDWGANSSPGCSLIHVYDVPDKKCGFGRVFVPFLQVLQSTER